MENSRMKESILAAIRGDFGKRRLPKINSVVEELYTVVRCPVCNHKTLDHYDICRHCGWEYDGTSGDRYSAANGATLAAYRAAYYKTIKERKKGNVSIL